jgi:hypothetical protein
MRCIILTVVLGAALGIAGRAEAESVDFWNLGTFEASTLSVGGVTVTASNTLNVLGLNGLGVVGGSSDSFVDFVGGEWISFAFDAGSVVDVRLSFGAAGGAGSANTRFEAFAPGGASLGALTVDLFLTFPDVDVSALFGGAEIASLSLTPLGGNTGSNETIFRLAAIEFTTTAAVPEPSSLALGVPTLLVGLVAVARRRRASRADRRRRTVSCSTARVS